MKAASLYETAFSIFSDIRASLRLLAATNNTSPIKEIMLVQNLNNPVYVDLVVGDLEQLPAKLAAVGKRAGSYSGWKKKQHVNNVSKISRNLLRKNSFIEAIVEISHDVFDMN